jgi:putative ABC transport system permease protein
MQSYRERIREFALLKTLGFSDVRIAGLVMAEAVLLCVTAAAIGLALAWFALPLFGKATGGALPHPPLIVVVTGLVAAALTGLVCGAIPAWKASRLTIAGTLAAH